MKANSRQMSVSWAAALGLSLLACSAASDPDDPSQDPSGSGASDVGAGGTGGDIGIGGVDGSGGTSSSGPNPTEMVCPIVPQEILMLDFRSGWWSGGGGGAFHQTALTAVVDTCPNTRVEYHHFEVSIRVKCLYASAATNGCEELFESPPTTAEGIQALFDKPTWDDYTQIWILSGSELDSTDVLLSGELFSHFLGETQGSCIPALIGAGDGFITHGNSVSEALGIGSVFTTEYVQPGFFSVAFDPTVVVGSYMNAGAELTDHVLFQDVNSITDTVSNSTQASHGDSIVASNAYQVVAHDSAGRAAIAVGSIELPDNGDRPFILDAGFQRYYGMTAGEGTHTLLQNMVKYLGNVGCKAEPPK